MRKLSILFILSLLVTAVMSSCRKVSGSGPVVSETRNVSGFSEVKSDFSGDVYITQGSIYNVRIEAQQNIIDVIETVLNDGILTLKGKSNTMHQARYPYQGIYYFAQCYRTDRERFRQYGNTKYYFYFDLYMKVSGSGNITVPKLMQAAWMPI